MKKKRSSSRRKPTKPPPAGASRSRPAQRPGLRAQAPALSRELQYKVVELSTVDEGSLERTLNEWTAKGWSLDGVQFAMRESSKRPAMAFVFFTREAPVVDRLPAPEEGAREKLRRLAGVPSDSAATAAPPPESPPFATPPQPESSVRTAVELAAAALFDVTPAEVERAAAEGPDGENGAVRWVELPEEGDE